MAIDLDQFIEDRSAQLHIGQDSLETKEAWISRVVYSVIGVMASTCLWNKYDYAIDEIYHEKNRKSVIHNITPIVDSGTKEDSPHVSDVYWKRFVKRLWYAYYLKYESSIRDYYPSDVDNLIKNDYSDSTFVAEEHEESSDVCENPQGGNWEDFLKEILDVYIQTGSFYKRNYYLAPARRRSIILDDNIRLERGISPGELFNVSGLGNWRIGAFSANSDENYETLYDLQTDSYSQYYQELEEQFELRGESRDSIPDDSVYLRIEPMRRSTWGQYWLTLAPNGRELSLGRFGNRGKERYYLFKRMGDHYKILFLKEFETNPDYRRPRNGSREYIRVASAILAHRGTLPIVRVKIGTNTAELEFGYLLPPAELSFFKLYSWPSKGFKKVGQNFNRRIAKELYPSYKNHLLKLGYRVDETFL